MKAAMTIEEAAEETPFSPATIRRAIHATDPDAFPPPLQAKRAGTAENAPYVVLAPHLQAWLESLPDA